MLNEPPPSPPLTNNSTPPSSAVSKIAGLHEWLSFENSRVKQWWSTRSGSDINKIYFTQLQAADELRSQLNEQLRALDLRVDTQSALVAELQDWFRRRAELHQDYSSKLDKLTKSLQARHKEQKIKREQWSLFSVYNCWQILVNQTKRDAKDHAAMADVYNNNIIPRFTEVHEDVQRIYKKCRDIGYESHEELLKVLHELHTTMRTYHTYQAEYKSAEIKLQNFEAQRLKLEQVIPKEKLDKSKKFRVIEKEIQKRKDKFIDAKLKALKARNEYILSMESANGAIHKYFVEDLSDIVDCMDFGFHSSIARALLAHISGQECFKRTLQGGIDELSKSKSNLDSRLDKQRFLEYNNTAFMLPKKFDFQSHKGDEVNHVLVTRQIQEEMEKRYSHLSIRLTTLKTESEETWKTIETAEKTLMEMINTRDYDIAHYFAEEPRPENKLPEVLDPKRKSDRLETEEFYLCKFRDYTIDSNLICRLQARFDLMRKALGAEGHVAASPIPTKNQANKPRRRRIGRTPLMGQPRLFGGSLEEYLESTSQEIPLIMKSCIRVINLYGLHHQGIFRVSGSQLEINNFRESFEKMEDPLADVTDASDINSVAGVLKLYLRELREPIFPTVYFEQFMEIAQMESKHDFVTKVREVATSLPRPVFVVMRYLFAFLNHLSEFSDENMMDPYNLAICFGPTLVPIPEDKDQVQYQNLVNELIKNIIIFSEDIFPNDGGPIYEKYISDLEGDVDFAPADVPDDVDSEPSQSEDDSVFRDPITDHLFGKSEIMEAVAQFDFTARSDRELSFNKGDILVLHSQVSSDWWKGSLYGRLGLIPDKYILLKIRDEDKDRQSEKVGFDDSKRRASSSSESILTSSSLLLDSQHSRRSTAGSPGPTTNIPRTPLQERSLSPAAQDRHSLGDTTFSSPVPSLNSLCSSIGGGESSIATSDSSPHTPPGSVCSLSSLPQVPEENGLQNGEVLGNKDVITVNVTAHCGLKNEINDSSISTELSLLSTGTVKEMPHSPKPRLNTNNRLFTSFSDPPGTDSPSGGSAGVVTTPGIVTQSVVEGRESIAETIELWNQHSRPSSQSSLSSSSSDDTVQWDNRTRLKAFTGTPDLVMDLPVGSLSSSPKDQSMSVSPKLSALRSCETRDRPKSTTPPGIQSPDISAMTAAECFAKQSQSTLKKTPTVVKAFSSSSSDAQTQTFLPAISSSADASPPPHPERTSDDMEFKSPNAGPSSVQGDASPPLKAAAMATDPQRLQVKDVQIELRAASDLPSPTVDVSHAPSTPKLAARYLQAVALSGGSAGVAVKPQVRIKPTVLKKPSLPRSATSPEPESSKGTN